MTTDNRNPAELQAELHHVQHQLNLFTKTINEYTMDATGILKLWGGWVDYRQKLDQNMVDKIRKADRSIENLKTMARDIVKVDELTKHVAVLKKKLAHLQAMGIGDKYGFYEDIEAYVDEELAESVAELAAWLAAD